MTGIISTKGGNLDHQDYIMTIIDDHEHVIDAISFAPEAACKIIGSSDYSKMAANN